VGNMGPDRNGNRKIVEPLRNRAPPLVARPILIYHLHRKAAQDRDARLAEGGKNPVGWMEGCGGADLDRFLSLHRSIGAEASLPLQVQRLFVEGPDQEHRFVKALDLFFGDRIRSRPERSVDIPRLIENLKPFDFKLFDDSSRHRLLRRMYYNILVSSSASVRRNRPEGCLTEIDML